MRTELQQRGGLGSLAAGFKGPLAKILALLHTKDNIVLQ